MKRRFPAGLPTVRRSGVGRVGVGVTRVSPKRWIETRVSNTSTVGGAFGLENRLGFRPISFMCFVFWPACFLGFRTLVVLGFYPVCVGLGPLIYLLTKKNPFEHFALRRSTSTTPLISFL